MHFPNAGDIAADRNRSMWRASQRNRLVFSRFFLHADSWADINILMQDESKPWDIFIGWSKHGGDERSECCAKLLNDLIEDTVGVYLNLYLSTERDGGEEWFPKIKTALAEAQVGIFCLTGRNQWARWLNFEAGAMLPMPLSRRESSSDAKPDERRIVPVVFGPFPKGIMADHPLRPFDRVKGDEEAAVKKLMTSLAIYAPDPHAAQKRLSDRWSTQWGHYQAGIQKLDASLVKAANPVALSNDQVAVEYAINALGAAIYKATHGDEINEGRLEIVLAEVFDALASYHTLTETTDFLLEGLRSRFPDVLKEKLKVVSASKLKAKQERDHETDHDLQQC